MKTKRGGLSLLLMRLFAGLLILFCGGVAFWGCTNNGEEIKARPEIYFIKELEHFAFSKTLLGEAGEPIDTYPLLRNDRSFLEFAPDFKSMQIVFVAENGGERGRVIFVVTSGTPRGGNIRGTASRIMPDGIDRGKLIRYSFWSDRDTIYLQTLVTYRVGTEHEGEHTIRTLPRDTIVAEFSRTPPAHVGGGG